MPFLDRFWQLRIAGGLTLIVAALALANAWSTYARTSRSATASPSVGAIFTLWLPLLAVAVALWWSSGAYRAYRRASARRKALAGDLAVMPPAAFVGDPARAPDLTGEPLVIRWRPNAGIQRAVLLIALLTAALDAVIIYGVRQLMGVKLPIPVDFTSFWPRLALVSAALLLLVLHGAILLAAPLTLRLRTGVTFTEVGVQERTRWGWRRSLRWEDARLFEVEAVQALDRRYTLYGARGAVSWRDEIPAWDSEAVQQRDHENYIPDRITAEEMSRRLRAALHLVAARTGLIPRTLSPSLQARASSAGSTVSPLSLGRLRMRSVGPVGEALLIGLTLLFFFLPAAIGVTFIYWQPATSRAVNILSGLALVAASEILLVALALALSGATTARRAARSILDSDAPAPNLPDGAPALLPLPGSYLNRRWSVALGLLLLIGGIPGIILLCLLAAEYLSVLFFPFRVTELIKSFPHGPGAFTAAALSFIVGLIGLGLAYVALSSATPWRRQVRVSADGLRIENGAVARTLPWDAIETLTLICVGPTPKTYQITADTGKVSLNWPAQADMRLGSAPPKGAVVLAPDDLAALIERQPGIRRRIRVIGMPEPPQGPALAAPDLPRLPGGAVP
jgi:hypothetical protein